MAIRDEKDALRRSARARRRELAMASGREAAQAVADVVLGAPGLAGALVEDVVAAAYWPIGSELDPTPLIERLALRGVRIALPVVEVPGRPLGFRRYRPGETLVQGAFGTLVPPPEAAAVEPAVVFAPLLAADRAGHRLGRGGGYYDLTLAALRARGALRAVGLCFAGQVAARVPHEAGDERLDWLVTEAGAIECRLGV